MSDLSKAQRAIIGMTPGRLFHVPTKRAPIRNHRRPRLKPTRQLLTERVMVREAVSLETWLDGPLVLEPPTFKIVSRQRRKP